MQFNLQRVKNANYPKKQQKFDQLLSPRLRLVWQCLLRGHNLQVHRCAVGQWSARDSQRASFNLDASKSASFLFCMKPTPPTLRELRNTSEWLKKKTEWRGHSIFQVGVLKVRISLPVGHCSVFPSSRFLGIQTAKWPWGRWICRLSLPHSGEFRLTRHR